MFGWVRRWQRLADVQEGDWQRLDAHRPFAPDEASGPDLERGRLRQVVHEACDRERAREDGCCE